MKPTEKRKLFLLLKVKEFVNHQGNIFFTKSNTTYEQETLINHWIL